MLYLVLTPAQQFFAEHFAMRQVAFLHNLSPERWQELVDAGYCYRDGGIYRAHETYQTPGFEMSTPDANGVSSEAGDRLFEDTREHMFRDGRLQI